MSTSLGQTFTSDLRSVIQSLRRSPAFTLVAIVTLALGIGANTSAFSILNALMLRPLPYTDSDRLDRMYRTTAQSARGGISPADYLDLRRDSSGYGEVAAFGAADMNLSEPGRPAEVVVGLRVSANLFRMLGITPERGRDFHADEEILGNNRVLLVSHRYWQTRLAGDIGAVGRIVRVNGEPHEIVGVLPESAADPRHLGPFDAFRPLGLTQAEATDRGSSWLRIVGRRSGAISRDQADGFIAGVGRRLATDFPAVHAGSGWRTLSLHDSLLPANGTGIVVMVIGLSGFVLLIACSNLANLLLARTVGRAREFAVRAALGASRTRLLRPLLLESLVLALAGGVVAIQVAVWTHRWLNSFGTPGVRSMFALDWRVLGWAFAACLFTALVFGFAPALFALRLNLNSTLRSGARGSIGGRGQQRFRRVLIAGQFALAMVLLSGAAIFARGLSDWNSRRFGWESADLITATMLLPAATYTTGTDIANFQRVALERLEALPGVASASLSYSMPFFGMAEPRRYVIAGRETTARGDEPVAVTNGVSPHYFETVGTPLISGRAFKDTDGFNSPTVFIINQAMATALFDGQSPLGRRIAQAGESAVEWGEIVGVAGDIRSASSDRLAVTYQVYLPMAQAPRPFNEIGVRASGIAPAMLAGGIRTAMMALDPDLPLRQLQPAEATVARAANYQNIIATILSFLAAIGLGLACLGIYGVIARTTAQRTGEFGIRLALGAKAGDITRLVLASGAKFAIIGAAIGVVGAMGAAKLIVAGFPGLQTSSVPVLAGVTVMLLAVAQLACYFPARSASRISPTQALRTE